MLILSVVIPKSVRIGPFIAKIWLFSELDLHFDEHSEKHPYVRKWAVQKKLIPQFVCTYYLGLLPKVHSTILSIQIQDTCSPPVERFFLCPCSWTIYHSAVGITLTLFYIPVHLCNNYTMLDQRRRSLEIQ